VEVEYVICDLCGQDDAQLVYTVRDNNYGFPGRFHLVQCRCCGLVYQNPRPDSTEIPSFYPAARYHPFRAIHSRAAAAPHPLQQQRARRLSQRIGAGRVLDVGCGSGLFLLAMREQGWRGLGVEPHTAAAQFARTALQLDVHNGDIFLVEEAEAFDLITLWDVLEHTPSPTEVLGHAHYLLKPGGRVALNLPNWDSLERRVFGPGWIALDAPRHFYHFGPKTMMRLMVKCGFTIETLQAQAPVLSLASNVLRWGGYWLRRGQPKAAREAASEPGSLSRRRQRMIQLAHLALRPPNAVANVFNRGAGLTVIAQKRVTAQG
jgi:2-polyprenyl-3-methyl-5-hydroxy-6-metoxy-1,4-benzoquinol methylase